MLSVLAARVFLLISAALAVLIVGAAAWAVYRELPRSPSAVYLHGTAGDGKVMLSWRSGRVKEGVLGWQYRKRTEGNDYGEWVALANSGIVEGLTNGRLYGFRVRGFNAHGKGAFSNEVTVVPVSSVEHGSTKDALGHAIVDAGRRIEGGLESIRDSLISVRGIEERASEISGRLSSIDERLEARAVHSLRGGREDGVGDPVGKSGSGGGRVVEREILPVHLRVHFANAQVDANSGELSARGVELTSMQRSLLQTTMQMLYRCAAEPGTVTIKPYGFASSARFEGLSNSDQYNLAAANRRAKAVHDALVKMNNEDASGGSLRIEAPRLWRSLDEMETARNRCVTTSQEGRSSFPGRVVVLELEEWGACTPAGGENVMPPCDG